jgi:hypothetical protein
MSRSAEYRAITTGIVVLCGLGLVASLGPGGERFASMAFAVLAVLVVLALVGAAVRCELRIRRRLAAIQPLTPAQAQRRHVPIGGRR